jgi:hypothetical protein
MSSFALRSNLRDIAPCLACVLLVLTHVACSQPDDGPAVDPKQDAGSDPGRMDMPRDINVPADLGESTDASGDMTHPVDSGVVDAGVMQQNPSRSAFCEELSLQLRDAANGSVIEVEPAAQGKVRVDGQEMTLRAAVSRASEGDTVLLADGTYTFPANDDGGFTGVYITTPGVTLRSASGNADAVIIDSNYHDHGNGSAPITIAAAGVTVSDLTVKRSIYHLVHLWGAGDQATLHNVRLIDGGQQFVKSSSSDDTIDEVSVTCSRFEMTDDGRDNVWGYGELDGNTTCYTGGIDSHEGQGWRITDNTFRGIYCDATGAQRPAHGMDPGARGNQTYQGGLSEHAIHMWDSPQGGGGHLIARNQIIDCARGIGLGFRVEVFDVVVRDNMIVSNFPGSREHDVGISFERARDSDILHNSVIFTHPDAYTSTIEYRWESTSGLRVMNNLTNGRIRARNDATATLDGNVTDAQMSWFVDATTGDLHLKTCEIGAVASAAVETGAQAPDFDHDARGATADTGADQCVK